MATDCDSVGPGGSIKPMVTVVSSAHPVMASSAVIVASPAVANQPSGMGTPLTIQSVPSSGHAISNSSPAQRSGASGRSRSQADRATTHVLSVPEHPSALSTATPCQPASVPVHSAVCVPSVQRMDAASAGAWASRVTSSPGQNSTSSGRSGSGTSHTSTSVSAVRVSPQTSVQVAV